jgi:hypothetical protein
VLEPEGRQLASELGNVAAFVRQDVMQERDCPQRVPGVASVLTLYKM